MKIASMKRRNSLSRSMLLATFAIVSLPSMARADLLVANSGSQPPGTVGNTIGNYNSTNGATINSSFINTGDTSTQSTSTFMALNGNDLFVADFANGTVGEYNATTGALINTIAGFTPSGPIGLAVDPVNNILYVSDTAGTVGTYNATTGAAINANLITGLNNTPNALLLVNGNLLVSNFASGGSSGTADGTVSEYNATSGALENGSFITGLTGPHGMVLDGNDLFVGNYGPPGGNSTVGEYQISGSTVLTASTLNADFITENLGQTITGLLLDGTDLLVANQTQDTVAEYSTTTPNDPINANFIKDTQGLNGPFGMVLDPSAGLTQTVPEPASIWLFAPALLGLGFLARRKRKAS